VARTEPRSCARRRAASTVSRIPSTVRRTVPDRPSPVSIAVRASFVVPVSTIIRSRASRPSARPGAAASSRAHPARRSKWRSRTASIRSSSVGKCRKTAPIPTPARRAISSVEPSPVRKTSWAAARRRSRFSPASLRTGLLLPGHLARGSRSRSAHDRRSDRSATVNGSHHSVSIGGHMFYWGSHVRSVFTRRRRPRGRHRGEPSDRRGPTEEERREHFAASTGRLRGWSASRPFPAPRTGPRARRRSSTQLRGVGRRTGIRPALRVRHPCPRRCHRRDPRLLRSFRLLPGRGPARSVLILSGSRRSGSGPIPTVRRQQVTRAHLTGSRAVTPCLGLRRGTGILPVPLLPVADTDPPGAGIGRDAAALDLL